MSEKRDEKADLEWYNQHHKEHMRNWRAWGSWLAGVHQLVLAYFTH